MVLLILESLGSTELLFILAMALVFFGPRKLPQISRSLGKNLAEFRRASDDFKRTWEREANLEEYSIAGDIPTPASRFKENPILNDEIVDQPLASPADGVIPRQPAAADSVPTFDSTDTRRAEPLGKSDWL